ncbi:MAG: MoaD/ThiS family protein [Thiobacillaceae bacterium]|jgi:molybdopterin synthase sulfur carrier subunit
MKVRVLYFARLREAVGLESEVIEFSAEKANIAALLDLLRKRGGVWAREAGVDSGNRLAVNQQLAGLITPLSDGDEVAIFPPVTGG